MSHRYSRLFVGLALLSGCSRDASRSDAEGRGANILTNCGQRLVHVWGAARAYAMENCIPDDQTIRVDSVVGYIIPGSAEAAFCPESRLKYPDFRLRDGPRCPAGHKTEASLAHAYRDGWHHAPTNKAALQTDAPDNQ